MSAPAVPQIGWQAVANKLDGVATVRHAVLTINGTWGAGQVQYPSDVVNGLAQYVNPDLCFEVPVQYPASMGPLGGSLPTPSYEQSVAAGIAWIQGWLAANPLQTFILIGYSQGAEVATRAYLALSDTDRARFAGGITLGNPCRGAGFHAPTIADPGGRGISNLTMTTLPTGPAGDVIWADYVHSPANGDPGLDMYASVPNNAVGTDMTAIYTGVTELQFNDMKQLATDFVADLQADITDLAAAPVAAVQAAVAGLQFLAAPGGPTAPHISYLGEIGGYSNLVADAFGFLQQLCAGTPARCAA